MMHPMLTAWGGGVYTSAKKTGGRALVLVVMAAAMALATLAVFAAEARAGSFGSFGSEPPRAVLMKYKTVIQAQGHSGGTWCYYEGGPGWSCTIYDNFGTYSFPEPDTVGPGRRLHVRFYKPQRPSTVEINAYPRLSKDGLYLSGQRRQLKRMLRPVKKDGVTVGWDVFFRVNQPERHYYLVVRSAWERVPGTRISYGEEVSYGLHVRTR
jgi:hypothetical protein